MSTYNLADAKAKLSDLVARAAQGEEIVIARSGRPLVRLTEIDAPTHRPFGQLRGLIEVPDDFDAPLPESELAAWE